MELITIVIIQLSLMAVGLLLVTIVGVKNKIEAFGLAYLLGSGLITILFFVFHWFLDWSLGSFNFATSLISSFIVLFLIASHQQKLSRLSNYFNGNIFKAWRKLEKIERMLLGATLSFFIYSLLVNYLTPMTDWDALAFYDFRARVMALRGNMIEGVSLTYFFQYPPYTSFLHVFGYLLEAERVKIAYSLIYGSLLVTFFSLLNRTRHRSVSFIATFLLASFPAIFEHSIAAYSNLSYTVFFSLGIIYIWMHIKSQQWKDLFIGALLIGMSTWIRSTEPFWIVAMILIIWNYFKNRSYLLLSLGSLLWLSLPNKIWRIFIGGLNNSSSPALIDAETHSVAAIRDFINLGEGFQSLFFRAIEVSGYLLKILFSEFFLISLLWFLASKAFVKKWDLSVTTIFLLLGIVWGGTFVFSFTFDTWNKIDGSIVRMSMIFIPLLIFSTVESLTYIDEKK